MKTKINKVIKKIILDALKEDLPKGDITSNTLVSKNEISSASIIAKNKEEYYIGPNYPLKLEEFFNLIRLETNGEKPMNYFNKCNQNYFDNTKFCSRTGRTIDFNIKNFTW